MSVVLIYNFQFSILREKSLDNGLRARAEKAADVIEDSLFEGTSKFIKSHDVVYILFILGTGSSLVSGDSLKKRDPTVKVKCHLCNFTFNKKDKRVRCHCKKNVHKDCFKGDGDECPNAPK